MEVVASLADVKQLAEYLPAYGHQLFAIQTARRILNAADNVEGKIVKIDPSTRALLRSLQNKIDSKSGTKRGKDSSDNNEEPTEKVRKSKNYNAGNKNALKNSLLVFLGWLMYDEKKKTFYQVREQTGGGKRECHLKKDWVKLDVLLHCKKLFFSEQNGASTSSHGSPDDFDIDVVDNTRQQIPDEMTVLQMYERIKIGGMKTLKCYMVTTKKGCNLPLEDVRNKLSRYGGSQLRTSVNDEIVHPTTSQQSVEIIADDLPDIELVEHTYSEQRVRANEKQDQTAVEQKSAELQLNKSSVTVAYGALSPRVDNQGLAVPQVPRDDLQFSTENIIGKGNFGTVYRATWMGAEVALKEIKVKHRKGVKGADILTAEVRKELAISCVLRHPNIVQLLGFCIAKNAILILSELVNGPNLDDILFDDDCTMKLTKKNRLSIAMNSSAAVCYMHTQHIVHQDIKCANILVDRNTRVAKICDFGLGRIRQAHVQSYSLACGLIGTPAYMAPECLLEGKKGYEKSDIWSLGCTLAELFTQTTVWQCEDHDRDVVEFIKTSMKEKIKPFRDVDHRYEAILVDCVHYEPQLRPTARQIVEALAQCS